LARLGIDINESFTRTEERKHQMRPAGASTRAASAFSCALINQFKNLDEMREAPDQGSDGNVPIRLKDIASVSQGFKEREGIVRIDGREAIELAIYKEGDANTVSVANLRQRADRKLKDSLPKSAKLTTIEDQSIFIEHALSEVKFDALLGWRARRS
jgi:HAE1 family hydrophobic/amphiphilic exporter-1